MKKTIIICSIIVFAVITAVLFFVDYKKPEIVLSKAVPIILGVFFGLVAIGILGVVLPNMYQKIYQGSGVCNVCGKSHDYVNINDSTVIREFSANYYMQPHDRCSWGEDDRYCVLVKWDDFITSPEQYIEQAFNKRTSKVVEKVRIKSLR